MKDTYSEREGVRVRNVHGCKGLREKLQDNVRELNPLELEMFTISPLYKPTVHSPMSLKRGL
jgi:hypothetical protein